MSAGSNVEIARKYLQAIEGGTTGDAIAKFFTSDVVCEEMPNTVSPKGRKTALPEMLKGAERGQEIFSKQTYEVLNAVAQGDCVALEFLWTGTLKITFGKLAAGAVMRDHVATFLTFREKKIARQTLYDCFEAWE